MQSLSSKVVRVCASDAPHPVLVSLNELGPKFKIIQTPILAV